MKKLIPILLVIALLFSLTSCNLGEPVTFEYDAEGVRENIENIFDTKGLAITLAVTLQDDLEDADGFTTFTYAEYQDIYMVVTEDETYICDFSDPLCATLYVQNDLDEWKKTVIYYNGESGYTREQLEMEYFDLRETLISYLCLYTTFSGLPLRESETVVAGRECDEYTFGLSLFGFGVESHFSVDRETGICLSGEFGAALGDEGDMNVTFVCKDFSTPFTIICPIFVSSESIVR